MIIIIIVILITIMIMIMIMIMIIIAMNAGRAGVLRVLPGRTARGIIASIID